MQLLAQILMQAAGLSVEELDDDMRSMAGRWSCVSSVRRVRDIHAYRSAGKERRMAHSDRSGEGGGRKQPYDPAIDQDRHAAGGTGDAGRALLNPYDRLGQSRDRPKRVARVAFADEYMLPMFTDT